MPPLPEIRVTGPLGRRSVLVNGYALPTVESVAVAQDADGCQRVTVTMVTDRARIDPPEPSGHDSDSHARAR